MPRRSSSLKKLPLRSVPRLVIVLLALSLVSPGVSWAASPYQTLLPQYQQPLEARFGEVLTSYDIDIRFRPDDDRITGSMTVELVNITGKSLDEVAFRLYPNALYYGEGYLTITSARVDGKPVEPRYQFENTVMRIPIPGMLAAEATTRIELTFRTVIPDDSKGTFGIFSHNTERNVWVLADWYPIVAGWDPDRGWRVDRPTPAGDPTYADAATYDLTVTLPDDLQIVATGASVDETDAGLNKTVSISTGPARDLTLVIGEDLAAIEATAGGTTVRVWAESNPKARAAAQWVADLATQVLAAYGDRFGAYPYTELDLVATPIRESVLGVSWTGLVMLSDKLFLNDRDWIDANQDTATFAITHEIGHEWWGAMIGANSNDHPFMVEGLTNALTIDAIADVLDPEAAIRLLHAQISGLYQRAMAVNGDGIVNRPVGNESPDGPSRVSLAYGKGALGFLAIRVAMGDAAYFAAIAEYADRYLYANAEPDDLRNAFIAHAPAGVDIADIWEVWFDRAVTTNFDIDTIVAEVTDRLYSEVGLVDGVIVSAVPTA